VGGCGCNCKSLFGYHNTNVFSLRWDSYYSHRSNCRLPVADHTTVHLHSDVGRLLAITFDASSSSATASSHIFERFDGEADESAVSWEGAAACDTSRLPYLSCYYHYHYLARLYSPGESRPFALCSVYEFFLPTHPSPVKYTYILITYLAICLISHLELSVGGTR